MGPFQKTVRAPPSSVPKTSTVRGPTSSPFRSSGIASAGVMVVAASSERSAAQTTSTGSTILSPASASSRRQVSTWSVSNSEPPTPRPCAARNVKHMPPPIRRRSTFGSSASMTASLSLTFEPPRTTT